MVDFFGRKLLEDDLVLFKEHGGSMTWSRYGIIKEYKGGLAVFDGSGCVRTVTVYKLTNLNEDERLNRNQLIAQYPLVLQKLREGLVVGRVYGTIQGKKAYYLYLGKPKILLHAQNGHPWIKKLIYLLNQKLDGYSGGWFYNMEHTGFSETSSIPDTTLLQLLEGTYIKYCGIYLEDLEKKELTKYYNITKFDISQLTKLNKDKISRVYRDVNLVVEDDIYLTVTSSGSLKR